MKRITMYMPKSPCQIYSNSQGNVFLEERDIKVKQNYIFSHVFNRSKLQNSN